MSELGDLFSARKAEQRQKRASNRESSAEILRSAGIDFERKNEGAHLIINAAVIIDFWPGTGKWIARNGARGRGVKSLIKWINRGCK